MLIRLYKAATGNLRFTRYGWVMLVKYALAAMFLCVAGICSASPIHEYTADGVTHFTGRLPARAAQYDAIIEAAAQSAGVESNLLRAVIKVESGFNPWAVSKTGAVGLMQLMPATAIRFGVFNRYDPLQNVRGGALYLGFLIKRFGQNLQLAIAAYNAGEDAVDRYDWRIPPFIETLEYVPKVIKIYQSLTDQRQRQITLAALPRI
jgi:soluble lytic murein transglycosylase-like protein